MSNIFYAKIHFSPGCEWLGSDDDQLKEYYCSPSGLNGLLIKVDESIPAIDYSYPDSFRVVIVDGEFAGLSIDISRRELRRLSGVEVLAMADLLHE